MTNSSSKIISIVFKHFEIINSKGMGKIKKICNQVLLSLKLET